MVNAPTHQPEQLRIDQFSIENFRTFRGRATISFEQGVTVFHGETGSGKSTALAALDAYFRGLAVALQAPPEGFQVGWSDELDSFNDGASRLLISERDRPNPSQPTRLAAIFKSNPILWVEVTFEALGPRLRVAWNRAADAGYPKDTLFQSFFPFGAASRPFGVLDARRRPRWRANEWGASLLAPALARELYELRTSRTVADRERWRFFASTLTRFPTITGATIEIEAGKGGSAPELVIERPGRAVLGLDELSSGEQELAALTAGLLLSKAAIVAIEEPEMGLDPATQVLWRQVCDDFRAQGLVHQIIYESHAVTFDGPRVVRFRRDADGWTQVESVALTSDPLAQRARAQGAKQAFVTRDGFTQLPEPMQREIQLGEKGAQVWFVRGKDTWEAWPEEKLDELLAEKPR